ncbi:MAG: hypothetical protein JW751_01575 [Polyangiaceae bacterium]|nr:hypothetical protein [Polyangiaceae bacterium]
MSGERTILMLARLERDERDALTAEVAAAACQVRAVDSLEAAALALAAHPPAAVLVDLELEEAHKLCRRVRTKRRAVDVAVFGLSSEITNAVFARALKWGVDDVVSPRTEGALANRLVALPLDPTVPIAERGDAVVATRDENENLIGRLLTNAGYDVEYASDSTSLLHLAALPRMRLVVASPELGGPRELIEVTRRRGGHATWVVLAGEDRIPHVERDLAGLPRVGVASLADSLDHILFVSNELGMTEDRAARRERRILYGALCAFHAIERDVIEHGFTYNVSPSGLYVRTLSPPREEQVRIDLLAPGTARPVRLEGHVAWRRGFGRLGTATAPPGFGVKLTGGDLDDRAVWARACTALLVNRAAPAKPRPAEASAQVKARAAERTSRLGEEKPRSEASEGTKAGSELTAESLTPPALVGAAPFVAKRSDPPLAPMPTGAVDVCPTPVDSGFVSASVLPITAEPAPPPPAPTPEDQPAARGSGVDSNRSPRQGPGVLPGLLDERPPTGAVLAPSGQRGTLPLPSSMTVADSAAVRPTPPRERRPVAAEKHPISIALPSAANAKRPQGRRSGVPTSIIAGLILGTLASLATVLVLGRRQPAAPIEPAARPMTAEPAPARAAPSSRVAPPAPTPQGDADGSRFVQVSASPSAAASAAPSSTLAAGTNGSAAESREPAFEYEPATDLLGHEGYLEVSSTIATQVFSNGVLVGPTGQRQKIRCGLRYVRLGDAPGLWRSEGVTVDVRCGELTRVRIVPSP